MGASGPIALSRGVVKMQMPATQGWIMVGGEPPPKFEAPHPGPRIGTAAPRSSWIGYQWAPGQGGDTPGGGGAALPGGMSQAPELVWDLKGYIIPKSQVRRHNPGSVGWVGSRRSGA